MRVAILGKGETYNLYPGREGNEHVKPYDEVWGLNQMGAYDLGLDKLFVMDDLIYRMPQYAGQEFCDWLKDYKGRIITAAAYDDWPTSEPYPIEEHCKYFGIPLGLVMYSTPDYMLAMAIMEGFDEIDLYGVDMTQAKGLEEMRTGTGLWIGVAMAKGIRVTTVPGSFYQFYTNVSVAMEYGLYGYAFRPRIENLCEPRKTS